MPIISETSVYLNPLGYNNLAPEQKTWITGVLYACSEYLEKYLNRSLEATDRIEKVDGNNQDFIQIANPPINFLTSIQFNDEDVVLGTEFAYHSGSGEIRWADGCSYFTEGFQNITVNYNGGYSPIPSALQMICAEMVMETCKRDLLDASVEKEKIGEYFVDFGKLDNLLMSRKKILSLYKLRVV